VKQPVKKQAAPTTFLLNDEASVSSGEESQDSEGTPEDSDEDPDVSPELHVVATSSDNDDCP
jgi:hypothetical protein